MIMNDVQCTRVVLWLSYCVDILRPSNGDVGPGATTWLPALDRLLVSLLYLSLPPTLHHLHSAYNLREPQIPYSIVSSILHRTGIILTKSTPQNQNLYRLTSQNSTMAPPSSAGSSIKKPIKTVQKPCFGCDCGDEECDCCICTVM